MFGVRTSHSLERETRGEGDGEGGLIALASEFAKHFAASSNRKRTRSSSQDSIHRRVKLHTGMCLQTIWRENGDGIRKEFSFLDYNVLLCVHS